jgi:two-component system, OmpR family, response regulator CpxR
VEQLNKTILVIDDDVELCQLLADFLGKRGFIIVIANDGIEGMAVIQQQAIDCVVLDVMLPKKDGFEVLRDIRELSKIPVVMLTARGDDVDRIVGLEMGADDYLAKPFNPRELSARITAILRRTESGVESNASCLEIDDLRIEFARRRVQCQGAVISLTNIEYCILVLLLQSVGTLLSKEELSEQALGKSLGPHDRSLDVHISKLRAKLGPNQRGGSRIKTVRGQGYLYESNADQ